MSGDQLTNREKNRAAGKEQGKTRTEQRKALRVYMMAGILRELRVIRNMMLEATNEL